MKKRMFNMLLAVAMVIALAFCGSAGFGGSEVLAASGETKETLTVAMECGYAPYNWTQSDDSNGAVKIKDSSDYAYGYDVMMAKKIAEALDMNLEIVKLDWDSLIPAVQGGTVDCVIAGQSITSERLEMVDFTDPYYYASIITLVKKDSKYADAKGVADLTGCTCTSQLGTIWYDKCLPQIKDANIQAAQESAPSMLVALNSGRTDVVVTDMPTGKAALTAYSDFKLLDFSDTDDNFKVSDEDINIGISVRKGNTELVDKINKVLSGMTKDDYDAMMDEAVSVQPLSEETTDGEEEESETAVSKMSFGERMVYLLGKYGSSYLKGAGTTLLIAIVGTFVGCVIGFAVGIIQTIPLDKRRDSAVKRVLLKLLKIILKIYVEVFRGTPMIVQAVFIYYGAAQLFNVQLGMWQSAFLVVSINTGAYMSESVRGGIISVDPGQMEGAKAIGMNHFQAMTNVIIPQAFRNIIPQIGNNFIINIKDSSVLSVISIVDLFFVHKSVAGALYTYFESATIVMVIYLTMTLLSSFLLNLWEKRLDGNDNYEVVDNMDIGTQLGKKKAAGREER